MKDTYNDNSYSYINTMIHNYKINTLIHNDLYGWLFNGVDANTGINVDVWVGNNERLRFIENDVVCMKMLFHRNVIQLYDVVSDDKGNVVVVKEKMPQLKLRDVVVESEMEVFNVFSQVVSAVRYMHCMRVVHLNLNIDNVMVNVEHSNVIKIGNFYYSKFINDNDNKDGNNIIVNEEFDNMSCVSPEIYLHLPFKPEMADVWSCGVILYYLIYKTLPFCNGGDSTINKEALINGDINYNNDKNNNTISDEVKDLISKMLESDQHKRISLEKVIKHKWFMNNNANNDAIIGGINWYKMKYPIDENILQLCLQYSKNVNDNNNDINLIKNDLLNIKYNANTALYKLCVIKHNNEQSISDLHSKAFINYISNPQNEIKRSAEQINNIISSFTNKTHLQTSDNINNNNISLLNTNNVNNNYSSNNNESILSEQNTQTKETIKRFESTKYDNNIKREYNTEIIKPNRKHSITSSSTREEFRQKILQELECNKSIKNNNTNSFNNKKYNRERYNNIKQSLMNQIDQYKTTRRDNIQIQPQQEEELTNEQLNTIVNNEIELAFKVAFESLHNEVNIYTNITDTDETLLPKYSGISILSNNELHKQDDHSRNKDLIIKNENDETQAPLPLPLIHGLSQSIAQDDNIDSNIFDIDTNKNNNTKILTQRNNNNQKQNSYKKPFTKKTEQNTQQSSLTKRTSNHKEKIPQPANKPKQTLPKQPEQKRNQVKHHSINNITPQISKQYINKNKKQHNQTSANTSINNNNTSSIKCKPKQKSYTRLQKHKTSSVDNSLYASIKNASSSLIKNNTERTKRLQKDDSDVYKNSITNTTVHSKNINMHIPDLDVSADNEIFIQECNYITEKDNSIMDNNNTIINQSKEEDIKCKHLSLLNSTKTSACVSRASSIPRSNYKKGVNKHNMNSTNNSVEYINGDKIDYSIYEDKIKQIINNVQKNINNKHKHPFIPLNKKQKHIKNNSLILPSSTGRNNTFLNNHNTSYNKHNKANVSTKLTNSTKTINNSKTKTQQNLIHSPYHSNTNNNSYQTPPPINKKRNTPFIPSYHHSSSPNTIQSPSPYETNTHSMQVYYDMNLGIFNGLIDIQCISHLNLQDTIINIRNKLQQLNIFYIQSHTYLFKCNSKTQRFDIEIKEIHDNIYYYHIKYKKTNTTYLHSQLSNNDIIPLLFN